MHIRTTPGTPSDDWINTGRMFDREEISYTRVDETSLEDFVAWMGNMYGRRFNKDSRRGMSGATKYLRRYNFEGVNTVLGRLSDAIRNGDPEYVSFVRDRIPNEMKSVDIMKRASV